MRDAHMSRMHRLVCTVASLAGVSCAHDAYMCGAPKLLVTDCTNIDSEKLKTFACPPTPRLALLTSNGIRSAIGDGSAGGRSHGRGGGLLRPQGSGGGRHNTMII